MKLIRFIENVKAYLPNKDIIIKGNEIISLKNNKKTIVENAYKLFDLGSEILVLDDLNTPSFVGLNIELIDKKLDYKVFSVDLPYIGLYKKKPVYVDAIYNYFEKKMLFQTEDSLSGAILNDQLFTLELVCRNIFNGNTLWHFDLSQFGEWHSPAHGTRNYEVKDFVGVYNNQLLVQLSNFKLIGIDVNTGKLVNEINLGELYATETRNFLSDHSKMFIDDANGKIIWLTSASLIHINIEDFSSKLVCNYFHEDYTKVRRFEATTLYKSKLYFTGKKFREGGDPDWVGVMEPNTGEILWEYPIENGNLYEAPQVTDTHLYVRDTISKTLYIFE